MNEIKKDLKECSIKKHIENLKLEIEFIETIQNPSFHTKQHLCFIQEILLNLLLKENKDEIICIGY